MARFGKSGSAPLSLNGLVSWFCFWTTGSGIDPAHTCHARQPQEQRGAFPAMTSATSRGAPAVKARLAPPPATPADRPRPTGARLALDALGRAIAVGDRVTAPVGSSGADGVVTAIGPDRVVVARADGKMRVVPTTSLILLRRVR